MCTRCDVEVGGPMRGEPGVKSATSPPMRGERGVKSHACQPMRGRLRRGGGVNFHTSATSIGPAHTVANQPAIKNNSYTCSCPHFPDVRHAYSIFQYKSTRLLTSHFDSQTVHISYVVCMKETIDVPEGRGR